MRRPRAWRVGGAIALLALLVAPALPGGAGTRVLAHAQLVASSPGSGAVLPESPDEIRLVFSEPLESQVTSLDVSTQDGAAVLTRAGEVDPEDPFALVVPNPDLPDGVYMLTWRSLSAADGHTAEGFLSFGIGEVTGTVVTQPGGMVHEDIEPIGVIGRWLTYVGLLLALGLAVFHRVVINDGAMPRLLARSAVVRPTPGSAVIGACQCAGPGRRAGGIRGHGAPRPAPSGGMGGGGVSSAVARATIERA